MVGHLIKFQERKKKRKKERKKKKKKKGKKICYRMVGNLR